MGDYIPFVTGEDDCSIISSVYSDCRMVKVPENKASAFKKKLPGKCKLWVDALLDGMHYESNFHSSWEKLVKPAPHWQQLKKPSFLEQPDQEIVNGFVAFFLEKCAMHNPTAVTVPQYPFANHIRRNKMNWALAKGCREWRKRNRKTFDLVLPLIITHQNQIKLKAERDKRVRAAVKAYELSDASALWVVDSSLVDQNASSTFRKRFNDLILFHEELNDAIGPRILRIGGPYWAMNLVLWARGLIDSPAIGVGKGFQYFIPGPPPTGRTVRLALPPLKRLVRIGAEFRDWLDEAIASLDATSEAHEQLSQIRRHYTSLQSNSASKRQIARFYKSWIDELAETDASGRGLALYQELSSAYVLGRELPILPKAEKTARRPEKVAEYLMLSCL